MKMELNINLTFHTLMKLIPTPQICIVEKLDLNKLSISSHLLIESIQNFLRLHRLTIL